jgi:hypothetical protein
MPARDELHDCVRAALVKDGWTITADPLHLTWGTHTVYVDLAADMLMSAEKAGRTIAVEVKGFRGRSDVYDLEHALGQYLLYRIVLAQLDPARVLYMAVTTAAFEELFESPLGLLVREKFDLLLAQFDPETEAFVKWIDSTNTAR